MRNEKKWENKYNNMEIYYDTLTVSLVSEPYNASKLDVKSLNILFKMCIPSEPVILLKMKHDLVPLYSSHFVNCNILTIECFMVS